jgi:hypothetical protein
MSSLQAQNKRVLTNRNIHHDHIENSDIAMSAETSKTKYDTDLTAGAITERVMVTNPADLTAVACNNPIAILVPAGTFLISGFPISSTRKKNQSVQLSTLST